MADVDPAPYFIAGLTTPSFSSTSEAPIAVFSGFDVTDVDPAKPALELVANFTSKDGAGPGGTLVIDAAGDIFGTTNQGGTGFGGTAFEVDTSAVAGSAPVAIADFEAFGATTTGSHPIGGVSVDSAGDLFGVTDSGTVFEVLNTPDGYNDVPVTLVTFDGSNGASPAAGVITDANGDLFGTTSGGGTFGFGTVFEIPKVAGGYGSLVTLASLDVIGQQPAGRLIIDGQGNLIGASNDGDDIFEIAKSNATATGYAATATEIASFKSGASGFDPTGNLFMDSAGDLFGTDSTGGANNDGAIFEIVRTTDGYDNTPVDLVDFDPGSGSGVQPGADLVIDAAGDLYGTTAAGGAFNEGAIYELPRDAGTATGYVGAITTLASFDPANGYSGPAGDLVADGKGNLFGATDETTNMFGAVFELTNAESSATCYLPGTRITTPCGETAIEDLVIGDLVITVDGASEPVRWIGRRHYSGPFVEGNHLMLPVCIKAGALANGVPRRDLRVSPGHAMFVDGQLVPAWRLVNGTSVTQADAVESVAYYHIELDRHAIILAEGAPAESFLNDGCRGQFHNAAEFDRLYHDAPDMVPLQSRLEDGFGLQVIQERIAARAGVITPVEPVGALRGFIDMATPMRLCGWAQDTESPEEPVALEVLSDGHPVLCLLANGYRADLRQAGLGSGCHAFNMALPAGLTGQIEVRRVADGAYLPQTLAALKSDYRDAA